MFTYDPLDPNIPSLRPLSVKQASRSSQPDCTLANARVDTESFIALSYQWQPPDLQASNQPYFVQLNGKQFEVQPNLWNFLCIAQEKFAGKNLWTDAICIDQTNQAEKSRQVENMDQVYTHAAKVLIWLGRGDGDTTAFINHVNTGHLRPSFFERQSFHRPKHTGPHLDEAHAGYYKIERNKYWRRLWIVQEVILAKDVEIVMGFYSMPWSALFDGMHVGDDPRPRGGEDEGNLYAYMEILRRAKDDPHGTSSVQGLADWVFQCRKQSCGDPLDRVYATLGLARTRDHFVVDYGRTLGQLVEYTLERFDSANLVAASEIARILDPPVQTTTINKLSSGFLDQSCPRLPQTRYVATAVIDSGKAKTTSRTPEEWKLAIGSKPFELTRCPCNKCSLTSVRPMNPASAVNINPQNNDIVTEIPQTNLLVLCRRRRTSNQLDFVACVAKERWGMEAESGPYYCYFPEDGSFGDLMKTQTKISLVPGADAIEWEINWRTAFALAEEAHMSTMPGWDMSQGEDPMNVWKHECGY
jgi:Heterokaryon incompatibility protein (HET)